MNVEMMKRVRTRIANVKGDWRFDMSRWLATTNGYDRAIVDLEDLAEQIARIRHHECGTVGCIAGWATVVGYREVRELIEAGELSIYDGIDDAGREILGLSYEEARYVFKGHWSRVVQTLGVDALADIGRDETLAYIDRCIEAGKVVRVSYGSLHD